MEELRTKLEQLLTDAGYASVIADESYSEFDYPLEWSDTFREEHLQEFIDYSDMVQSKSTTMRRKPRVSREYITELERLYVNLSAPKQAALLALSEVFDEGDFAMLANAMKKSMKRDYRPIDKTVQRSDFESGPEVREERVFSVRFMAEKHQTIFADTVYSKTGVLYSRDNHCARVVRGVPENQDAADLLSSWTSTHLVKYIYPVWKEGNDITGQLLRAIPLSLIKGSKMEFTASADQSYNSSSKVANVATELRSLLKGREFKNKTDVVNHIQGLLYDNSNWQDLFKSMFAMKLQAFTKWETKAKTGEFAPSLPSSPLALTTFTAAQATNRAKRNEGVGGEVFHRTLNSHWMANYDAFEIANHQTMMKHAGKTASIVADQGAYDRFVFNTSSLGVTHLDRLTYTAGEELHAEKTVVCLEQCKAMGPHVVTKLLAGLANSKAGQKCVVLVNPEHFPWADAAAEKTLTVFRGWKILLSEKVTSFHTSTFICVFERVDSSEVSAWEQFSKRSLMYAMMAQAGENYMHQMYLHGIVGRAPDINCMYHVYGPATRHAMKEKAPLYTWDVGELVLPPRRAIVVETSIDLSEYLVDDAAVSAETDFTEFAE